MMAHSRTCLPCPRALALGLACLALPAPACSARPLRAQQAADSGSFVLHKFLQPIGSEHWQRRLAGDTVVISARFEFRDRGMAVPLAATLRERPDGTPLTLELKGRIARQAAIDEAIVVAGDSARIRRDSTLATVPLPARYFTVAAYAPVVVQQELLRYALRQRVDSLTLVPLGPARLERRGTDTVVVAGRPVGLTRYGVSGVIWGRETLWADSAGSLAALVGVDAEFDHFEAVAPPYEEALRTLVARAAQDGMAALAEIGRALAPADAGTLVLRGGTLVDGTGRPPLRDAVVVARDGRIVAVGPRGRTREPAGARVIDVAGLTILPGLWDMHAHFEQVEWGPVYLAAGITTVRDVGNEFEFIRAVRDALAAGRGLGPRMLLAGVVDGNGPRALGVDRVESPEDVAREVRKYHDARFQQMKIYSSVPPALVPEIARVAHALGMTVTGHVPTGMDALQAVRGGMDQINHANYILTAMLPSVGPRRPPPAGLLLDTLPAARAVADTLKRYGTVVDPTLAVLYEHPDSTPVRSFEPAVDRLPPQLQAAVAGSGVPNAFAGLAAQLNGLLASTVRLLFRAGVPIVAGTDQGLVPGYTLDRELELYVRAGLTPLQAIQAATLVPARVMGLARELGTVEVGKRADLALVEGDPLADIRALRQVRYVVTGGRLFETAPLWRAVGFRP